MSPFKVVNVTTAKKMRQCSAPTTPIETKIIESPIKLVLTSEAKMSSKCSMLLRNKDATRNGTKITSLYEITY